MTDWNRHFTNCQKISVNSRIALLHKLTLTYTYISNKIREHHMTDKQGYLNFKWEIRYFCSCTFVQFTWTLAYGFFIVHFQNIKKWHQWTRISIGRAFEYLQDFQVNLSEFSLFQLQIIVSDFWSSSVQCVKRKLFENLTNRRVTFKSISCKSISANTMNKGNTCKFIDVNAMDIGQW